MPFDATPIEKVFAGDAAALNRVIEWFGPTGANWWRGPQRDAKSRYGTRCVAQVLGQEVRDGARQQRLAHAICPAGYASVPRWNDAQPSFAAVRARLIEVRDRLQQEAEHAV